MTAALSCQMWERPRSCPRVLSRSYDKHTPMKPHNRRTFLAAAAGMAVKPALGASQDLAGLTLKKASDLLRTKAASPVDLTQACLKRIERYNGPLNAFITITTEQALADPNAA